MWDEKSISPPEKYFWISHILDCIIEPESKDGFDIGRGAGKFRFGSMVVVTNWNKQKSLGSWPDIEGIVADLCWWRVHREVKLEHCQVVILTGQVKLEPLQMVIRQAEGTPLLNCVFDLTLTHFLYFAPALYRQHKDIRDESIDYLCSWYKQIGKGRLRETTLGLA